MSARDRFDIIVVGVGAMGASTCWHLARRGVRVLGLEAFDIPNTRGSSHGFSRMIRMAYYEHADYVPLLRRAYDLWEELERQSSRTVLHVTGGLYMGRGGCELIEGSRASAERHGLAHEMLDHRALRDRYPQFAVPEDHVVLLEPRAGFLEPEKAIAAFAEAALRTGHAEIRAHEPVTEWRDDVGGDVIVRTNHGEYRAARVVFCGGAWTDRIVRALGVPLVVTRQVMGWVWPRANVERFELGRLPVWAIDRPGGSIWYGFPMLRDSGSVGFKLALHAPGNATDPDRVDRAVGPADEESFRECLRRFIPDADGPLLAMRTCLYTNSPDAHFILDRHPRHERAFVACGFSGHGFKFASVIGEVLADWCTTGRTELPVEFLSLARFGGSAGTT